VNLDLNAQAAYLTILRCGYDSPCRASNCGANATTILRKSDRAGRPMQQIELCDVHGERVVERERRRGLGVTDWRGRSPTQPFGSGLGKSGI